MNRELNSMKIDQSTLTEISAALNGRLAELKEHVATNLANSHQQGSHLPGGVDTGDESQYEQRTHMVLTSVDREAKELELVEHALNRIKSGDYGECIECGNEIGQQRLLANPIAKRCIDCQSTREDDRDERDSTPSM